MGVDGQREASTFVLRCGFQVASTSPLDPGQPLQARTLRPSARSSYFDGQSRAVAACTAIRRGSTEPERVVIGTPSRGEKPIVVSIERLIADGRDRASTTEVASDETGRARAAEELRRALRRPLRGRPMEAGGAECPTPPARLRGRRTSRPRQAISSRETLYGTTATWGTSGSARIAVSIPAEPGVLCSGAMDSKVGNRRSHACRRSAWARRDAGRRGRPDGQHRPRGAGAERPRTSRSPQTCSFWETRRSFRLVEPALTTRTACTRSERPGPVANLGIVFSVLSRIGPCLEDVGRTSPAEGAKR